MRKTTMTVAAFLAVAASSYAAVTVGNNGYKATIKKDATATSIEVALKKGTYGITSSAGTVSVTSPDGKTTYADPANVIIPDAGATVKITATLGAKAEKDTEALIKIEPKSKDWTDQLQSYQNKINALVTEASALPTEGANAAKRTALLDEISLLQDVVNNAGIEEYNEFVDNGSVAAIEGGDNGLDNLTTKVSNATANETAYNKAIAAHGALDLTGLEAAYTTAKDDKDIDDDTKAAAKALYDQTKADVAQFKTDAENAYAAGTAAVLFSDAKISEKIGKVKAGTTPGTGLKGEIEDATEKINAGNTNDLNYAQAKAKIQDATTTYNDVADLLYDQLEADGIPTGYGKDIYDDLYKAALAEMKVQLDKITAAETKNEEDYAAGKAAQIDLDDVKNDLNAIYGKYIDGDGDQVGIGDKDDPALGTLRYAYKTQQAALDALTKAVADGTAAAVKDTDTDKDGKVIKDYFAGKVTAINKLIAAIQTKLDAANAAHTIDKFSVATEQAVKDGYDAAKTALDKDLAEYEAYAGSRTDIDNVEKELTDPKTGVDVAVAERVSDDGKFVAADRFATSRGNIVKAISDLRTNNRKNYAVTATDAKLADTYAPTVDTEVAKIHGAIVDYDAQTVEAYVKFTAIADAITEFNLEIDGREQVGKVGDKNYVAPIASWASKVLNENVTIDGKLGSKTYGEAKAELEAIVAEAQAAVDAALAVAKDKEADFMTKLTAAFDNEDEVEGATAQIKIYKNSYADNVGPWQDATNVQAKADAIAESVLRASELNAAIDKIADYKAEDYGTAAAAKLNAEKTAIYNKIGDAANYKSATAKEDGTVAERIKFAYDEADASVAVALIAKVQNDLDTYSKELDTHKATAAAAKTVYATAKGNLDEVQNKLTGKKDDKDKWVKGYEPVTELLYPYDQAFLNTEIAELQALIDAVDNDLQAAPDVALALPKAKDAKDEVGKDITNRTKTLLASVNDLREKAQNESANEQARLDCQEKLDAYRVVNKVPVSVAQIFDDTEEAIKVSEAEETDKTGKKTYSQTTDGEQFFLDKLYTYKTSLAGDVIDEEYPTLAWLNKLAIEYYQTKTKENKVETKYTDPKANLAANKDGLMELLDILIENVEALPAAAVANENAYDAETAAYDEAKEAYEALFVEVNKAKDSLGENYKETYESAIDELAEINSDLKAYKNGTGTGKDHVNGVDEDYEVGESVNFDGKLTKINAIKDAITKLEQTWNAGEDEEGSYKKAVAEDNADRKAAFDAAFSDLYDTYYGKMSGSTKIDGAVDVVTKLSKLDFADEVSENIKAIVTGDKSLYTYADKIAKLQKDAQADYDKTKSPDLFDDAEDWKAQAATLKAEIVALEEAYAGAVNTAAWDEYVASRDGLKNVLDDAKQLLKANLGMDDKAATTALALAKNADGKTAQMIFDEAQIAAGEKPASDKVPAKQVIDFAYQYQNNIVPAFVEAAGLVVESVLQAAEDDWNAIFEVISTDSELAEIEGFYGAGWLSDNVEDYEAGYYADEYDSDDEDVDDIVSALEEIDEDWAEALADYDEDEDLDNLIEDYGALRTLLSGYITTRTIDKKNVTHTNLYWTAYDENEQYKALTIANADLVALQSDLQEELEAAVADYSQLLVEHDTNLGAKVVEISALIEDLTVADLPTAGKDGPIPSTAQKAIEAEIGNLTESAILKEYEAIAIELGELAKNFGDEDGALAGFVKTNETIYNDHVDGKKDAEGKYILDDKKQKVKADAAEVYERYAALEKEIGAKKSAIDETSKTAATEVANALSAAQEAYDALVEKLAETDPAVQEAYEDDLAEIASAIEATSEKIQNQGTAVSIEKDNNLEAIGNINTAIEVASTLIDEAQEPFTARDQKIAADTEALKALTDRLASVNSTAAAYKHQYELDEETAEACGWVGVDEDGEEVVYTNYREYRNNYITDLIQDALADVSAQPAESILDPDGDSYYDVMDEIEESIADIEDDIKWMEKFCARIDCDGYYSETGDALEELADRIDEVMLDNDKKAELVAATEELAASMDNILNYRTSVYWAGKVKKGLDGEYINEDKSEVEVDFVQEAYPAVREALEVVNTQIVNLAAEVVTPGAITDPYGEVQSADISIICDIILGITDPQSLDPASQAAADVDGNQKYNVADLTKIQNIYLYGDPEGFKGGGVKAKIRDGFKIGALGMDIETSRVNVNLATSLAYAAIQMDVTLPEGVVLTEAAFAGNEEAVAGINQIADNTWRVLLYGANNASVSGNNALLNLSIAGKGEGTVTINNVIAATAKGKAYNIAGISGDFDIATGIAAPETETSGIAAIFGANGAIRQNLEKGLNIIKTAAGEVKKIFVK